VLVDAGEDFASGFDDGAGVEEAPPLDEDPPDELDASALFFSAARESVR